MIKNIWSTQSFAKGILVFHISQMIRHTKPTNLYFVEFLFWLNGVALMLLVSIEGKSMREVWKGPGRYFLWHKIHKSMVIEKGSRKILLSRFFRLEGFATSVSDGILKTSMMWLWLTKLSIQACNLRSLLVLMPLSLLVLMLILMC